ncbi:molybdopterin-binding/glycosyltransferase family 2 protein [Roseomonas sp. SSH11]|uniref:Molybdopterin-binding/glycosyltransferase family 2 protein n=1 Tax=Pararoseomonas baculiformis TaxID=2820812 RepID=A0ABS4AAB0_9PROT|nr:molybdopterin-binding/glycosyltransferase family 2 protein [Pararoseomonas baculiformis]MBP0443941.1 molybdopterin-binding/glycosyltransferase family 2 protein [Pararoseomonas baculiformis]
MLFGPTPLDEARGAILAHTLRLPDRVLKKGTVLDAAAIEALRAARHGEVIAARLESGDVPEDEAADRMANAMLRPLVARSRAATGRVNLLAETHGLLRVDVALIDRVNALDESLTLATLADFSVVQPKDMLATIKVIPFSVPAAPLQVAEAMLRGAPALTLHPFRPLRVGLVSTELPGMKEAIFENGVEATRVRIEALAGTLLPPERSAHETAAVADALTRLRRAGAELLLILGASAVVDRRDVAPAGILRAGGVIEHFGMPVDPGNLLCLGRVGPVPALVLPGCARSPKVNGFDWVLERLLAGVPVTPKSLMRMGVGGLLKEIDTRPLPRGDAPRSAATTAPRRPRRVAALVLAAGRSRRMAPLNKLMVTDRSGQAMVARVVDNALASRARPVLVVTGHERERVEDALAGRPVLMTHAEDYAEGLSSSLKAGIAALPPDVEGVLVMLGDMPLVSPAMLDRIIAGFDPEEGRAIVQPTFRGKQGNPVLWGREFFGEILSISGDVGARHLTGRHAERLHNVEMADDGVLRDFDTVDTLKGL